MTNGPFDKCPVCGGELERKNVEKLIRGGDDIASLEVRVDVCLKCGEKLFTKEDIQRFESIRNKLKIHDLSSLQLIGRSFQEA